MVRAKNIYNVYFNSPKGSDPGELSGGYLLKCGFPLLDFSCGPEWRYSDYIFNAHHIQTKYYRDHVLPEMENVIHFGYNSSDFRIVPCFSNDGMSDLSYSFPINDNKIFQATLLRNGKTSTGKANLLRTFDNLLPRDNLTNYHKLFIGTHDICRIVNMNGTGNGRKLIVVGDSMSVPYMPILVWYYNETVYVDARDYMKDKNEYRMNLSQWVDSTVFDDVIIQFFHETDIDYGVKLKTDLFLS